MTDNELSPLQKSLVEDIALEQEELNPGTEEKDAEEIVNEVEKQLESEEKESDVAENPEGEEEDDEIPANPTNKDFAKLRAKQKEAEREAAKWREEAARKEGYIQAKKEGATKEPEYKSPEDPEPDFDLDPKSWAMWSKRQSDAEITQLKQQQNQGYLKNQLKEFVDTAKAQEDNYAKENPDYSPAKSFLTDLVIKAKKAENPLITDRQAEAFALQEEYAAMLLAKQMGFDNPAYYFEMLAKKAGFKPTAKQTEEKSAEKKTNIEAIKRNKEKSISLAGTHSNASGMGKVTDEEVVEMTLEQMAQAKGSGAF